MRDKVKNKGYFDELILEDNSRINSFSEKIEDGKILANRVQSAKEKIVELKLKVFIASYSRGDELVKLRNDFVNIIQDWMEHYNSRLYNINLTMLSIGISHWKMVSLFR